LHLGYEPIITLIGLVYGLLKQAVNQQNKGGIRGNVTGGIQRICSGDYIDRLKLNHTNEFIRTSRVVFWLAARE
jgi:hypothetical protein